MRRCHSLPDRRVANLHKNNARADNVLHPLPLSEPMKHLAALLIALVLTCAASAAWALDINQASEADLDSLKGVGPATTARILVERQKGDFASWADLMARVKGIKSPAAARLSAQGLTVNGQPHPNAPNPTTATAPQ